VIHELRAIEKTALILAVLAPFYAAARAETVPTTVRYVIHAPANVIVVPAVPTVPCDAKPGTVVAKVTYLEADTHPVATLLGPMPLDLVLDSTTLPATLAAELTVGPEGVAAAHCGTAVTLTLIASQ
jgi:hypothetical protein